MTSGGGGTWWDRFVQVILESSKIFFFKYKEVVNFSLNVANSSKGKPQDKLQDQCKRETVLRRLCRHWKNPQWSKNTGLVPTQRPSRPEMTSSRTSTCCYDLLFPWLKWHFRQIWGTFGRQCNHLMKLPKPPISPGAHRTFSLLPGSAFFRALLPTESGAGCDVATAARLYVVHCVSGARTSITVAEATDAYHPEHRNHGNDLGTCTIGACRITESRRAPLKLRHVALFPRTKSLSGAAAPGAVLLCGRWWVHNRRSKKRSQIGVYLLDIIF